MSWTAPRTASVGDLFTAAWVNEIEADLTYLLGISGRVADGGTILAGTGFTVSHTNGTGLYTITFTTAFAAQPLIVLAVSPTGDGNSIGYINASASSFTAQIDDKSGTAVDHNFDFWARGIPS